MVRTKADGCASSRKVVAAQAPRKGLGGSSSSRISDVGSPAGKNKYAGGNPVCQRPTPEWQKGISTFLTKSATESNSEASTSSTSQAGSSSSSQSGSTSHSSSDNS